MRRVKLCLLDLKLPSTKMVQNNEININNAMILNNAI